MIKFYKQSTLSLISLSYNCIPTMKLNLVIFALIFCAVHSQELYRKVVHSTDTEALCLDGSSPFLYYHEGVQSDKFLIFFNGGGLCQGSSLDETIADCYNRSKGKFGSSNGWPDTMEGEGYLSTNSSISNFSSWNKIIIGYCDGSLHQGYRKVPISYKGEKLYFRGAVNTRSHFKWIMNKFPLFKNSNQIVVTGVSAGGMASFYWTNYVRSLVNNASNVVTIIDSGAFIISKTYQTNEDFLLTGFVNMFKLANIQQKTPLQLCNAKYQNEQYKCLFIQYAWTSFQSRTLLINSQYDSQVISNGTLKMKCLTKGQTEYTLSSCSQDEKNFIEDYRKKFKEFLELFLMYSKNSGWTIGCSQHGYSPRSKYFNADTQRVPAKTGYTIKQVMNMFVFQKQRIHAEQMQPWPANTGCAL